MYAQLLPHKVAASPVKIGSIYALGCPGAKEYGHQEQQTKFEVTLTPYELARDMLWGFGELPIIPASQKSRAHHLVFSHWLPNTL